MEVLAMVNFTRFVEAGRVVFIASGPHAKKVAIIVEIIDQRRVLIDGPCSGVPRQEINLNKLHLTKLKFKLPHGCGTNSVKRHWLKYDITKHWESTAWARKLHRKSLRAAMTDFDRFKVMVARKQRNNILKQFKLKKPDGKIIRKKAVQK
uniref:Large ribosomal subunit protein eL14 n=2 Tax=Schistosoma japonicum TaxID=6182 RepID=C1LQQ0_SCHJA|nr:ribosomal protein L14 [Schistosoma japonicum]